MSFFKKPWVVMVAVICAITSIVLFALHGFIQTDIAPFIDVIWAVVDVVGISLLAFCFLLLAIRKLLLKKDTAGKWYSLL